MIKAFTRSHANAILGQTRFGCGLSAALVPCVTNVAVLLRLVRHGGGAGQPGSEPGRINRSGHQDRCTATLTGSLLHADGHQLLPRPVLRERIASLRRRAHGPSRPITASHMGPENKQESKILTQSFTELAQSCAEQKVLRVAPDSARR